MGHGEGGGARCPRRRDSLVGRKLERKGRRNDNKEGAEGGNEGHGRIYLYYPTESPR
ncbi:hypothetical protein B0H19DRAFT_1204475 [Mycena capillaripes]|nr:hypothetical protein B0H19DRAFT_1204475 [Mycena capillaripes]